MNRIILLFSTIVLLASCSPQLSPFTQKLYEENRWTEDELRKIQFYLSQDLVLKRQIKEGSSEIINGKIKMENGRQIEEIVIRRGTPGVFVFSPKDSRFGISFEEGGEKKYLMFGPNPKYGNRYLLLASDWDRRQGKVQYDSKFFYVDSDDAMAGLLVDLRRLQKTSVDTRTAKGRRVDE